MNKYYTPNIEEFYVGFEYERKHIVEQTNSTVVEWRKQEISRASEISIVDMTLGTPKMDGSQIRVKYLDDSDIEELGFKYKAKTIDLWFEKEGIYLREDGHHLTNIKLQYGLHDNKLKITFCYVSGEEQIHFEGKIKNKSELVKLLKMLEIN